jgi:uncharacterized protein (DUF2336 family)
MTISASNDFISELDRAIGGGSPARRCQMLRQITNLFLAGADRLDARQIGVFDDVLVRLMERVETSTLAHLSRLLAALTSVPREAVRRLAFHEDATVAAPVLQGSGSLSERDLIEIAGNRSQPHLLAISGRTTLSEAVTDAILKRADAVVCRVLVKNKAAHFSDQGCSALVARADRDDEIADSLMLRPQMPVNMRCELVSRATKTAQARLLKLAPPEQRATIQAALERIALEASSKRPEPADYSAAKSKVLALSHDGKLNDSAVNRFAVRGERTNLIAALSLLTDAAIETIEPIAEDIDPYGLIVACRASRLNWQTTLAVISHRRGARAMSSQELEQRRAAFDTLCLSVAQWTIRFGSVRDLATKSGLTGGALKTAAGAT